MLPTLASATPPAPRAEVQMAPGLNSPVGSGPLGLQGIFLIFCMSGAPQGPSSCPEASMQREGFTGLQQKHTGVPCISATQTAQMHGMKKAGYTGPARSWEWRSSLTGYRFEGLMESSRLASHESAMRKSRNRSGFGCTPAAWHTWAFRLTWVRHW